MARAGQFFGVIARRRRSRSSGGGVDLGERKLRGQQFADDFFAFDDKKAEGLAVLFSRRERRRWRSALAGMARCSAGSAVAGKLLDREVGVGEAQPPVGHPQFGAIPIGDEQADLEIFVGRAVTGAARSL